MRFFVFFVGGLLLFGVIVFVDFFVGLSPWLEEEFGLPVGSVLEFVAVIGGIGGAILIIFALIEGISSCGEKIDSLESKMDDLGREIDNPYDGLKGKMDNLEEKMDDLKNEIDGGYYGEGGLKNEIGDLKGKMDNLEEKMDEIRRDLRRNEESGRTEEESEED